MKDIKKDLTMVSPCAHQRPTHGSAMLTAPIYFFVYICLLSLAIFTVLYTQLIRILKLGFNLLPIRNHK